MFLKRVNLENQLRLSRKENSFPEAISIDPEAHAPENRSDLQWFDFDLLDAANIYHITHIKRLCVNYRLRFLDAAYFKAEFPGKTLLKIRNLEQQHHTRLSNFKIVAPSRLMRLKNPDNPLLFVPMGNEYYYLIDRWGNDLHPMRKFMVIPLKNPVSLIIFITALSAVVTLLLPLKVFSPEATFQNFGILFLFIFKMLASIIVFYGVALGKNFSEVIWNSRYSKN